jgi:hypothetical protein
VAYLNLQNHLAARVEYQVSDTLGKPRADKLFGLIYLWTFGMILGENRKLLRLWSFLFVEVISYFFKDGVEHRLSQPAGLRVLAARMIGDEKVGKPTVAVGPRFLRL